MIIQKPSVCLSSYLIQFSTINPVLILQIKAGNFKINDSTEIHFKPIIIKSNAPNCALQTIVEGFKKRESNLPLKLMYCYTSCNDVFFRSVLIT